jgi:hypothetical protein
MPITLNCACGKILRIPDQHAGKRVKCPACNGILATAPPQPAFEVVEEEPKQLTPARPQSARPRADEDDDDSYSVRKAERASSAAKPQPSFRKRADDDDDDEPRPRKKKKPRMSRRAGARAGAETGRRIGYIAGGAFGLVLGILCLMWGNSGEGRGATRLMIFGGIIAIAGLIGLLQGITGNLPDPDEE